MLSSIGSCVKSHRSVSSNTYTSRDDLLSSHRQSHDLDLDSTIGISTEEAQTLTVVSSPFTEKAAEKTYMSMDTSSTTLHGHYAVPAAKESSFSVTTTSTVIPQTHRHFIFYSKDHTIDPIRLLARHPVLGPLRVQVRLWRISSRLNRSGDIPDQFYQDLIELQK